MTVPDYRLSDESADQKTEEELALEPDLPETKLNDPSGTVEVSPADPATPETVPPAAAPTETPPIATPPTDETTSDWWASSTPAADAVPPKNQSAEVRTAAALSASSSDEQPAPSPDEVPTEPLETFDEPDEALDDDPAAPLASTPTTEPAPKPAEGTRQLDAASAPAISVYRSQQGLAAMALRDIGRVREINQDNVFALLTTLPREGGDVSVGLFIVADGMGGHHGGEVASRLAIRTVAHHVISQLVLPALDDRISEALQPMMISAVQEANEAIWDSAQVMGSDMGTTCTAILLVGSSLYIAHVGDTRAYLYEPGGLRQLTVDHSTVGRLIQLGQLEPEEAREHPLRNQLYRTIGQQPQVMVDFIYQPIGSSSHLLICSDGLWGMLDEATMEQALMRSPWPQDICHELIALANLAGGEDNISAVVVTLPLRAR